MNTLTKFLSLIAIACSLVATSRPVSADLYVMRTETVSAESMAISYNGLLTGATAVGYTYTFDGMNFIDYGFGPFGAGFTGLGVNSFGHIVGYSPDNSGNFAAIYATGPNPSDQFISYSLWGGIDSFLSGVNDRVNTTTNFADFCGYGLDNSAFYHAEGYDSKTGIYAKFAEPAGTTSSYGLKISDTGVIIGNYFGVDTPNGENGYIWDQDTGSVITSGTLPGGTFSYLQGISADASLACGAADFKGNRYAVLWNGSKLIPLAPSNPKVTLYDEAYGVRSDGRTVGLGMDASGQGYIATLWDSSVEDLNKVTVTPDGKRPHVKMDYAWDINEAGQIVCDAVDSRGNYVPVRLDPIGPVALSIPAMIGMKFTGTVTLNMAAPADVYVTLLASDTESELPKSPILIKKGQVSGNFTAKAKSIPPGTMIVITASDTGLSCSRSIVTN